MQMNIQEYKSSPQVQEALPQLVKGTSTYKMFVPRKVEEKFRYLLRKYPSTEWSGVLFIKHTGSFENTDLEIYCEDFFPMDLGTSGWTEFKMSEAVTAYMADNIELFDCDLALVHSHHKLGAFLSGQDLKMVQQEGNDTNCFVSLVVDTKGEYVACVTRKVHYQKEITTKDLGSSYEFFGEGNITVGENPMSERTEVVDREVIEYYMLNVQVEQVNNPLDYLDKRFEEIEDSKRQAQGSKDFYNMRSTTENSSFNIFPDSSGMYKKPDAKEQPLFDDKTMKELEVSISDSLNPALIRQAVARMLLCSLNFKVDANFDLKQWVHRHMENVYSKVFPALSGVACSPFDEWCDFATEFFVTNFDDPDVTIRIEDVDTYYAAVATAMIEDLEKAGSNYYIDAYITALSRYTEI